MPRIAIQAIYGISLVVTLLACGSREPASALNSETRSEIQANLSWITLRTESGVVRAAVARPPGRGPFPTVVILHGTHGFAQEYVQLARDLAETGVLAVAACWFKGGTGAGTRFVTPLPCEEAPRFVDVPGLDRFRVSRFTIDALVGTLRSSPDVLFGKPALFGHSRGGGAALDYASSYPNLISALVLNSTGYPDEVVVRAANLPVPVLILHGEADGPADGGSLMTSPARARRFEEAFRKRGGFVEAKYYDGGHNAIFADSSQYRDSVRRIADFVGRRSSR